MIVDHFGKKTLDVLIKEPEKLRDVPGISAQKVDDLIEAWKASVGARDSMIFLQTYGVTSRMANHIYKTLGNATIPKVRADPYVLADEVMGIGFIKADQIAQRMGLATNAPERLRAGLYYALNHLAQEGHTCAPRALLIKTAQELLSVDEISVITGILEREIRDENLYTEVISINRLLTECVYLPMYHRSEKGTSDYIKRTVVTPSVILTKTEKLDWNTFLSNLVKSNAVTLSDQQQGAVKLALTSKVSILTGGPGTGKTTTLRMVINALEMIECKYALASPTGRAAKRLAEATGREAQTIHRLFKFKPGEGYYVNQEDPLKVDMLIIDEASMLDILLFYAVLGGLSPNTHLMLVGDIDQLPSVGAGNVLNDLITASEKGKFPIAVTRLKTIFRQDKQSHIIVNAHRINQGELPFLDNQSEDFYFFGEEDPASCAELIVDIVQNRIPNKFGYDPLTDVQVIAPMYRGAAGVLALNKALQGALNKNYRKAEKTIGGRTFRIGDKVMQTKNNYELEVFNGDIGYVRGIDFDDNYMEISMDKRIIEYDFSVAEELLHAYCISTHRSQGSEYPVVVMPILTQHYMMLQRNLIYTAITRAKNIVILVGTRQAVAMAVRNNKVSERYTGLLGRLIEN
jgi:exodeoxyribonuclease V alpha subunit